MRYTLARLLLRRLTAAGFTAGLLVGTVTGYIWKTVEIALTGTP